MKPRGNAELDGRILEEIANVLHQKPTDKEASARTMLQPDRC